MEYWDIYDKEKRKTGRTMKRNDWILKDGEYHLSVLGAVKRPDGRFLILRRSMTKAWAPGCWEIPGGAVMAGEESEEAVIREIREETGLDVSGRDGGYVFSYHRENPGKGDNYFEDIYCFTLDFQETEVRLRSREATDWKLADAGEIRELAGQGLFLHYDSIRRIFEPAGGKGKYGTILFDLDGTLTDSGPGIRNSVAYSLRRFGIEVSDSRSLDAFIGPPLMDSFRKYYGFDEAQARQAVQYYREYFEKSGMFENRVYEGIGELLAALKQAGRTVVMATSKPESYAVRILEHFGIDQYFDYKAGASMDESRTDKAEVISYALEMAGITEPSEALMVGDREHDVYGAAKLGMDCVGVLYGYGSRGELEAAGAKYLAETAEDILPIALKDLES